MISSTDLTIRRSWQSIRSGFGTWDKLSFWIRNLEAKLGCAFLKSLNLGNSHNRIVGKEGMIVSVSKAVDCKVFAVGSEPDTKTEMKTKKFKLKPPLTDYLVEGTIEKLGGKTITLTSPNWISIGSGISFPKLYFWGGVGKGRLVYFSNFIMKTVFLKWGKRVERIFIK